MGTVLAQVNDMSEYIQMSFFESTIESHEAFALLLKEAQATGRQWGAERISGSLNIHVNYGLGFLSSHFDHAASFGMNHNPPYYNQLFITAGFNPIDLVTYRQPMKDFLLPLSERAVRKLTTKYTVRPMRYKQFKKDIEVYTRLNNDAFQKHLFYYKRNFEEDYELFKQFKVLLNEENLLFVERDGKPVGFMLWYPDFNELIPEGHTPSLRTVIAHKLFKAPIKTFKIVEMGIIEAEQKGGAIFALFYALSLITQGRFDMCETSWILKDNHHSSNIGLKWSEGQYKSYAAYTRTIDDEDI